MADPMKRTSGQKPATTREEQLDLELDETFPASDPPALTQPATRPGGPEREDKEARARRRKK